MVFAARVSDEVNVRRDFRKILLAMVLQAFTTM